jgi:hypothetical protein
MQMLQLRQKLQRRGELLPNKRIKAFSVDWCSKSNNGLDWRNSQCLSVVVLTCNRFLALCRQHKKQIKLYNITTFLFV